MSGRISASRASAARAAQQAKAARDAERLRRERQVESALTDFYEQTGRAEQLRAAASARAAKVLADAEAAAQEPERLAKLAVVTLQDLGEPRDQIAELTGLSLVEVRTVLAEAAGGGKPRRDGRGAETTAVAEAGPVAAVAGSDRVGSGESDGTGIAGATQR
ncbi:hypothetical protein ACIA8O_00800 [Kitasatospora sp. NPDC051853]|uniref:hypothetical protein n=1 Tax=Kitasatospora sp. NPDC051853 TaxID=3364058 RepID=UPI0037B9A97C